jgi:DNA-binding MarR family transcriptional regulator
MPAERMEMEKDNNIAKKCPLCEKHCAVNYLACMRGRQLFDDSDDLFHLMRRCGHVLYHSQDQNNGQGRIVHILSVRGSISQHELQEILNIQPGSLSEIVGKLEAKGYLTKERDEKDQRRMILKVTALGRKSPEEKIYLKCREELFQSLSENEQKEMKKLLRKLLSDWLKIEERTNDKNDKNINEKYSRV